MSLGVARVERFRGLNVASDPNEVGLEAAVSLLNVELADDLSYVQPRRGFIQHGADNLIGASSSSCLRAIPALVSYGAGYQLCISATTTTVYVDAVSSGGINTAVGNFAASGVSYVDAINYGTPTTSTTFIATDGIGTLRKVSSATLASSVGKPRYLGVLSDSNRLIQGWFSAAADSPTGANGSKSTVFFSDAGAPETFSANNYVHLRPGDGEEIQGIVTWRGQTFVFKQSVAFVFGPESTDEDGNPVFDYRAINLRGLCDGVTAGEDGVYYTGYGGMYRTTGGNPVEVSKPVAPLFKNVTLSSFTYAARRPYAFDSYVATDNMNQILLFSERTGEWVLWDPSANLGSFKAPLCDFGATARIAAGRNIFLLTATAITDDGVLPSGHYQSGYADLGASTPKVVTRAEIDGAGLITSAGTFKFSMGVNSGSVGSTASFTVDSGATYGPRAFDSRARRGQNHCWRVDEWTSAGYKLNGVNLLFRKPSPVGTARL